MMIFWFVLQLGLLPTNHVSTLTRVIGHDEQFVVETLGPADKVVKSSHGETWLYPSLCLEIDEQARVSSGCVYSERSLVCYYDGTRPRPTIRPCSSLEKK